MHVMVLLLLVAGLALLVLGLMTGSTPLVVASIAASLLAAYVIVRVRRQQESAVPAKASGGAPAKASGGAPAKASDSPVKVSASAPDKAAVPASEKARVSAGAAVTTAAPPSALPAHAAPEPAGIELVKAGAGATSPGAGPAGAVAAPAEVGLARTESFETVSAGIGLAEAAPDETASDETAPDEIERAETASGGPDPDGTVSSDDPATPEPAVADTDPPLRSRGEELVWVIDGRPRYHLPHCGFLLARQPEPVPLRQAVEDGFTPCALCDPDTGLAA